MLASDTKRTTAETYVKSPSFCLMNKPIEACSGSVKFHQNDQKFLAQKLIGNISAVTIWQQKPKSKLSLKIQVEGHPGPLK